MKRRLAKFRAASVVTICVVSCGAWAVSWGWGWRAELRPAGSTRSGVSLKYVTFQSSGGCLVVAVTTGRPSEPTAALIDDRYESTYVSAHAVTFLAAPNYPPFLANRFGFAWLPGRLANVMGMRETMLIVPWWAVAVPSAVLPVIWLRRRIRTLLHKPGHCPGCGYDLRATPDRCPECGRSAA